MKSRSHHKNSRDWDPELRAQLFQSWITNEIGNRPKFQVQIAEEYGLRGGNLASAKRTQWWKEMKSEYERKKNHA